MNFLRNDKCAVRKHERTHDFDQTLICVLKKSNQDKTQDVSQRETSKRKLCKKSNGFRYTSLCTLKSFKTYQEKCKGCTVVNTDSLPR